jgi:2-polyprenyl-3-methyl-5-hydroxy-6-metoxy-1,4-benzoquinol methylase
LDAQERLSLAEAREPTLLGAMHVHRYELAAELCRGLRVVDIGCGTGYGSEILSRESPFVLGVDVDVETITAANEELGAPGRREFEVADANDFMRERLRDRFDAIVMLETLEHLSDVEDALISLRRHADDGVKLVVSMPNSRMLDEDNPFHLTDFGFEEAKSAFAGFPEARLAYQFLAEGSLMQVDGTGEGEHALDVRDRGEREYANHFIVLVNFGDRSIAAVSALMRLKAEPLNHRYMQGLERANEALRRANARLARGLLGRSDTAAATLLARVKRLEEQLEEQLEARRREDRGPAHELWIANLHDQIAERDRMIAEIQSRRGWRVLNRYWAVRGRLRSR